MLEKANENVYTYTLNVDKHTVKKDRSKFFVKNHITISFFNYSSWNHDFA